MTTPQTQQQQARFTKLGSSIYDTEQPGLRAPALSEAIAEQLIAQLEAGTVTAKDLKWIAARK